MFLPIGLLPNFGRVPFQVSDIVLPIGQRGVNLGLCTKVRRLQRWIIAERF